MHEDGFLRGDDLEAYRIPPSGLCWWCGSVADSQEHKFKLKNLKRLSQGAKGDLVWVDGEIQQQIRSIKKSHRVRFRANLCAQCNNTKSQPFDFAYDRFMDYLWSHGRRLHRSRHVNMKHIYGETWATESINLARYLVKQIGCRIEHDGFGVPAEFVDFLNGSTRVPSLHMVMYKDPDLWKMHKNLGDGDDWVLGEGFGPMTGEVSPSQGRLMMFSSSMVVGYIGVMYRWELGLTSADPFYVHQKARLYRRDKLPDS